MRKILFAILSIIGMLFLHIFSLQLDIYNKVIPKIVVSFVCIYSFYFFLYQQKSIYKGIWYKPSNIFLLSYIFVSFQYLFDLVIGYKSYADFYIGSSVNKMSVACLLGLISFVIGYMLTNDKINRNSQSTHENVLNYRFLVILQILFFVGWILTVNIRSLLSGYLYFEDFSGTSAAFYENLFYDVTVAILITIVNNCKIKGIHTSNGFFKEGNLIIWVIIGIYCLFRLVSGDRGPCLYMILAVFFSIITIVHKNIKVSKIIVFAVIGIITLNIVGMSRSLSLDKSFSDRVSLAFKEYSSSDKARFSDKTLLPMTEELAMSNRCNQIAINLIDSGIDKLHGGKYAFFQLIQCIPFVPSFLQNTLKIPPSELSANIKMTDVYYGRHDFAQIGTTVVADAYFDFGLLGVFFMLILCGILFRKVDFFICISQQTNWFKLAIFLLFASMAVYIPRSTLIIQLKQLCPICLLYYSNLKLFNKL